MWVAFSTSKLLCLFISYPNFHYLQVDRVRHSKRGCRCTFMIKWLDQDLEGQTFTLPSSSIMKLATKSISAHPIINKLLKPEKHRGLSYSSPLLTILEGTDSEIDLNKLLQKQIEQISNLADASKKDFLEDIPWRNKGKHPCHWHYLKILMWGFSPICFTLNMVHANNYDWVHLCALVFYFCFQHILPDMLNLIIYFYLSLAMNWDMALSVNILVDFYCPKYIWLLSVSLLIVNFIFFGKGIGDSVSMALTFPISILPLKPPTLSTPPPISLQFPH